MEGYKDPFNRGCYPWGRENQELLAWYRRLGEIREEHPVFKEGSFRLLKAKGSLLAYVREDPEGKSPSVLCAFCSGKIRRLWTCLWNFKTVPFCWAAP